ncbi:MAG: rhomboid family intramembrane serine protease [Williamsia sp.]|nr:rhomboid family intramembrane serine protease [Williamsia sp.]
MALYGSNDSLTPVVKNLLIANVLVFVAQLYFRKTGFPLELYASLWPIPTGNFRVWQLVTYMFMHADWYHIIFNMIGLYMFGTLLERFWGSKRFLQFYVMCGLAAGIVQLLLQQGSLSTLGASGAVMGILAAFGYLFPNTDLYLFFIPIPIKAKYAISGFILLDLWGVLVPKEGDNIGHYAHLGGALAGLIIVILWNRNNRKDFY